VVGVKAFFKYAVEIVAVLCRTRREKSIFHQLPSYVRLISD